MISLIDLPKKGIVDYIKQNKVTRERIAYQKEEHIQLLHCAFDDIRNNKVNQAIESLLLCTWLDKSVSISELKKRKILSLFSYLSHKNLSLRITSALIENADFLNLDLKELEYLTSLKNLSTLHEVVKRKRASILNCIRARKKTLIKSLYSYIDKVFQDNLIMQYSRPLDVPNLFGREDVAEAISYIIVEYKELFNLQDENILRSDVIFIMSDEIENLITDACHIKLVHKYEVLIESLGYRCDAEGNTISIYPPSADFFKSWRTGSILLEMNRMGDRFYNQEVASLVELAKKFNEATDNYMLYWDVQTARYMIMINEGHLPLIHSKKYLLGDGLFREEIDFLREVEDLLLLPIDKLKEFEIVRGFTFYDLLMIKRVLTFLTLAYFDLLEKKEKKHYHSSNIPFWGRTTIKKVLAPAIGETKTEIFFNTFSFKNGFKGTFDIQYTPLLLGEDYYIAPLNIIINSNLFRNILYPLGKRIYREGGDPISEKLSSSLQRKGFRVKTNYKYKYKGAASDMDVIAIMGNDIFLFECKNSVLPVNAYEVRGSYKELRKAAEKQLPLAISACKDRQFLKQHEFKIENENEEVRIHAAIVTTYKIFSGHNINGFPIRNVKQLCEFINTGEFSVAEGGKVKGNYCMWAAETFSIDDLIAYLSPGHFYYKIFFDSMKETKLWNKMDNIDLYESHYELDWDEYGVRLHNLKLRLIVHSPQEGS